MGDKPDDEPGKLADYRERREIGRMRPYTGPAIEVSNVEIRKASSGNTFEAALRGDALIGGDSGYWVMVVGWGGTEAEARASLKSAIDGLPRHIVALITGAGASKL